MPAFSHSRLSSTLAYGKGPPLFLFPYCSRHGGTFFFAPPTDYVPVSTILGTFTVRFLRECVPERFSPPLLLFTSTPPRKIAEVRAHDEFFPGRLLGFTPCCLASRVPHGTPPGTTFELLAPLVFSQGFVFTVGKKCFFSPDAPMTSSF